MLGASPGNRTPLKSRVKTPPAQSSLRCIVGFGPRARTWNLLLQRQLPYRLGESKLVPEVRIERTLQGFKGLWATLTPLRSKALSICVHVPGPPSKLAHAAGIEPAIKRLTVAPVHLVRLAQINVDPEREHSARIDALGREMIPNGNIEGRRGGNVPHGKNWCNRMDLNHRRPALQTGALPG